LRLLVEMLGLPQHEDVIEVGGPDRCIVGSMALALPRTWVYNQIINGPQFLDPVAVAVVALSGGEERDMIGNGIGP
jgi:hypothetical protein